MKQGSPLALVRKLDEQPVTHTADGKIIIHHVTHVAAPDALVVVRNEANAQGIEPGALVRAATRAGLTVRIGRQVCARRSDLLRLVELLPKPKPVPAADDPKAAYAALVGGGGR